MDLPAKQMELLWGDATFLVAVVKPWWNWWLGAVHGLGTCIRAIGRQGRDEQPWSGTVRAWVCRMGE